MFSIKNKISILIIVLVVSSFLITIFSLGYFVKNETIYQSQKSIEKSFDLLKLRLYKRYNAFLEAKSKKLSNDKKLLKYLKELELHKKNKDYTLVKEAQENINDIITDSVTFEHYQSVGVYDKTAILTTLSLTTKNKTNRAYMDYSKEPYGLVSGYEKFPFSKFENYLKMDELKKKDFEIYFTYENDMLCMQKVTLVKDKDSILGYIELKTCQHKKQLEKLVSFTGNELILVSEDEVGKKAKMLDIKRSDFKKYKYKPLIKHHQNKFKTMEATIADRYVIHMHTILLKEGKYLYLVVASDKSVVDSEILSTMEAVFAIMLVIFILIYIIVRVFLDKIFIEPIDIISNGIDNLHEGKYLKINIQTKDELGKIAQEINLLSKKLKTTFGDLEQSKQFTRDIIDTVPYRIFWKDRSSRYLGANQLFLKDAKLEKEEDIIGKSDRELKWKIEAQSYIDDDNEVMESKKEKLNFEETQTFEDGTVANLVASKVPLLDKNSNVIGMIGVYDDITELKKEQEKAKQKDKMLIEQSKMASMGEMIGNIAHQWRQPLSVISTGATGILVQKEYGLLTDDMLKETCENIDSNAQYLSKTIDDFKNFIKGERKKEKFNIYIMMNEFLNLMKSSVKTHHLNVILDIQEDISIVGHKNELIQCLINIFNNSKDALKENCSEEHRYIFISALKDEKNLTIHFKDSGGGIPEDILPKIFEPYFTTKEKSKGTGLGLSMTYNMIVEGMKGSIEAGNKAFIFEDKELRGVEFKITLPLS